METLQECEQHQLLKQATVSKSINEVLERQRNLHNMLFSSFIEGVDGEFTSTWVTDSLTSTWRMAAEPQKPRWALCTRSLPPETIHRNTLDLEVHKKSKDTDVQLWCHLILIGCPTRKWGTGKCSNYWRGRTNLSSQMLLMLYCHENCSLFCLSPTTTILLLWILCSLHSQTPRTPKRTQIVPESIWFCMKAMTISPTICTVLLTNGTSVNISCYNLCWGPARSPSKAPGSLQTQL